MIEESAANAVGEVWVNGSRKGHCVLIGKKLAVTCAHVLARQDTAPKGAFTLDFKRICFRTETAQVLGWVPFNQGDVPRGPLRGLYRGPG